jgi:phospholipid transport system substrate-binding protein
MRKSRILTAALAVPLFCSASASAMTNVPLQERLPHTSTGTYTFVVSAASDEVITGATNFIESVSSRGLDFLSDPHLSHVDRKAEFSTLLRDSFDLDTIARFALGRYWRQASPQQRDEYIDLFKFMVVDTYAQRFEEYQGQQIAVGNARPIGDKDALVNSRILGGGGPEVSVDWRVRYKDGQYRIIDVLVEGVSMSVTQRSEFSSIIQRGGGNVEALLAKLRR